MAAPEEAGSYPSPAEESHHAPLAEATPPRRQDTNHADVIYQPQTIDNEVHTPPKKTGGAGAYLTAQYESGKFSSSPTATARLPSSSTASKKQQKLGQQSRLRQDRASGALDYVAGRYNTKDGARHTVNNALRHGIGDAYAAYVGQVSRTNGINMISWCYFQTAYAPCMAVVHLWLLPWSV